jgi:hypothetical protein
MWDVNIGALQCVFRAELLRYYFIVESGIKTDKPTCQDFLVVVFEEKNEFPNVYSSEVISKG